MNIGKYSQVLRGFNQLTSQNITRGASVYVGVCAVVQYIQDMSGFLIL